jgi:hypothetical protein
MTAVRVSLSALLVLALAGAGRAAERTPSQGPYLGVLFSPVAEVQFANHCYRLARPFLGGFVRPADVLVSHLTLPGAHGVLVTQVLPDSPAARSALQRGDILLRYNETPIRDCQDFARLIQSDKPDNKVKLGIKRDSQESTVEATLVLGPALHVAPGYSFSKPGPADEPRGFSKPQSSVSVSAAPLEGGKLKVVIEYYQKDRLRTLTCQGDDDEVNARLLDLPERERKLALAALDRLRATLNRGTNKPDRR